MKIEFVLLDGTKEMFETAAAAVTIGRANTCDIALAYEGFSRKHCKIEIENGEIFVTDLGSANGVLINGERLPVMERTSYQPFFNLQIGPTQAVTITLDESESAANSTDQATRTHVYSHKGDSKKVGESTVTKQVNIPTREPKITLDHKASNKSSKSIREKKSDSAGKKNQLPIIVLVLVLVAGSAFFFLNQSEENTQTEAIPEVTEAKVEKVVSELPASSTLVQEAKAAQCAGEAQTWCQIFGLKEELKEGVVIKDQALIVVFNYEDMLKTRPAKVAFTDQTVAYEIALLERMALATFLGMFPRQTQLTHVVGVLSNSKLVDESLGEQGGRELASVAALKFNRDVDYHKFSSLIVQRVVEEAKSGDTSKLPIIKPFYEFKSL